MKAVLVVDIRDCGDCPCSGEEFGMCQAVNNEKECDYYNIPSWCPLKPLPKGHGRLKDIDKVERLLDLDKPDNILAKGLKTIIESVPTVIEADTGETE